MKRLAWLVIVGALALAPTPATADDSVDADASTTPPTDVSPGHRALATGAALVPGVLLNGSGHFALGRRSTAYRLLALEGIGFALAIAAAVPLWITGANRYVARSLGVIGAVGVGFIGTALQADLYGTLMPLDWRGSPPRRTPLVETELGYRYVNTEQFAYSSFLVTSLDLRWQGLRLTPSAWFALDDRNTRERLEMAYRFFGPRAGTRRSRDGSFVELQSAITRHHFGPERFDTLTGEVFALGRLDLQRFDPMLTGTFSELGVGFGLQAFDYDLPGHALGEDRESLLLGRLGFGFYLGGPEAPRAEVVSFYEHRHDDYAGGLVENAIGVPGHIGATARVDITEQIGFSTLVSIGADIVTGLSVHVRQGITP